MDNLVSLLKAPGAINNEVRTKILELIQLWASAFEGNVQLGYVNEVYRNLKAEGYVFPPTPKVSSTFVDSSAVSYILSLAMANKPYTDIFEAS
jgi:growth factor-regulated tyrosine kinase substrate